MPEPNDFSMLLKARLKQSGFSAHPHPDGYLTACSSGAADPASVGGVAQGMPAKGEELGIASRTGRDGGVRNRCGRRWLFYINSLIALMQLSACAVVGALPFSGDSWKEEVLLHDGSKLVITRSQTYGGSHEIGQPLPIKEHTVTFTLPHTNKTITWTSEYGKELGRTNFHLLAVHVLNGTPYIVTEPNLCLSYNKWGRPNPPYIFFRYDGTAWQRISLEALPSEFTTMNVVLGLSRQFVGAMVKQRVVSVEQIQKQNNQLSQLEYKTILREPMVPDARQCGEMIYTGKESGWVGLVSRSAISQCLQ